MRSDWGLSNSALERGQESNLLAGPMFWAVLDLKAPLYLAYGDSCKASPYILSITHSFGFVKGLIPWGWSAGVTTGGGEALGISLKYRNSLACMPSMPPFLMHLMIFKPSSSVSQRETVIGVTPSRSAALRADKKNGSAP
jgi:hypothetical protein